MVFTWNPGAKAEIEAAAARAKNRILHEIAQDAERAAPKQTAEMATSITVNEGDDTVEVGSDHWQFVEYGTENMRAQPFMRPALYRKRNVR